MYTYTGEITMKTTIEFTHTFMPTSDVVYRVNYNSNDEKLFVEFQTTVVWEYSDVDWNTYSQFRYANSPGEYYNGYIKGFFQSKRLGLNAYLSWVAVSAVSPEKNSASLIDNTMVREYEIEILVTKKIIVCLEANGFQDALTQLDSDESLVGSVAYEPLSIKRR
jgi:KTSC domain